MARAATTTDVAKRSGNERRLMTRREASEYLGVSQATLSR